MPSFKLDVITSLLTLLTGLYLDYSVATEIYDENDVIKRLQYIMYTVYCEERAEG